MNCSTLKKSQIFKPKFLNHQHHQNSTNPVIPEFLGRKWEEKMSGIHRK